MYNPACFVEIRPDLLSGVMAQYPLAVLAVATQAGVEAMHVPLLHSAGENAGLLRGHIARANPLWSEYRPESSAVAVFRGPEHYISPRWYPSKAEHGRVVPTWNYVVVHARGPLRFIEDPEWLLDNVRALTDSQEGRIPGDEPWRVSDAPEAYIAGMLKGIVGVEMTIETLEGKWKISQNRSVADREGVVTGLRQVGTEKAAHMASLVAERMKS